MPRASEVAAPFFGTFFGRPKKVHALFPGASTKKAAVLGRSPFLVYSKGQSGAGETPKQKTASKLALESGCGGDDQI